MQFFALASLLASYLSASAFAAPSPQAAGSALPAVQKYLFTFGDAATATGFSTSGTVPTIDNPLGNPPYPGNTACGGVENWVDFSTTTFDQYWTLTYNLATNGATIDPSLAPPTQPGALSLKQQVDLFMSTYGNQQTVPWNSDNAVAIVWMGMTDLTSTITAGHNITAFNTQLMSAMFPQIQRLHDAGFRRIFFMDIPPLGQTPALLQQGAATSNLLSNAVIDFNAQLTTNAITFEKAAQNAGTKVFIYSVNTLVNSIIASPSAWGFQDSTSVGAAGDLMWCNSNQLSSAVHMQIAGGISANMFAPCCNTGSSTIQATD